MRASLTLDRQRGHLLPWAPVCLGIGISLYFWLAQEPERAGWVALAVAIVGLAVLLWRLGGRFPPLIGLLLLLCGVGLAGLRAHLVAGPVLDFRYYGPIQGRVIEIDRSASGAVRLTLDRVILSRVDPDEIPHKVRVSLHGEQRLTPEPGVTLMLTGHLGGPEGPVEPGGYDFRRQAWFAGLGAVGYSRVPAVVWAPAEEGRAGLLVQRLRTAIGSHVREVVPGRAGAFAVAVTTGDRSSMDEATLEALRVSNLAHLLAISGLHMGMLTGFVFALVRYGLALWPHAALRWPVHRIGAVAALLAGAIYLLLSGGSVATERAFIMAAVMLIAVLWDRRALTLRAVALAGLVILVLRPETLAGPGFQMSFSATIALIAIFAALRDSRLRRLHPAARWILALVISSGVAGLATAPFAAAHFNRVPHYGLIANMLSVPVMGALVMPAAVVAAVLSPFGLSWIGLRAMQPGIEWILWVADWVTGFDGASSAVVAPQEWVLPVIALGGLWLCFWQGRLRLAGAIPVVIALAGWTQATRPDILISGQSALVGMLTDEGRSLSKTKGAGFAASSWLENDGDDADQAAAAGRPGFDGRKDDLSFRAGGLTGRIVTGRGGAARARAACGEADIVVTSARLGGSETSGRCLMLDAAMLDRTGPIAGHRDGDGLRLVLTERMPDAAGAARPWNRHRVPRGPVTMPPARVDPAGPRAPIVVAAR